MYYYFPFDSPLEGIDESMNVFEPVHRTPSLKRTNYPVIEGYHFAYINGVCIFFFKVFSDYLFYVKDHREIKSCTSL
jgi:hypothetical protein